MPIQQSGDSRTKRADHVRFFRSIQAQVVDRPGILRVVRAAVLNSVNAKVQKADGLPARIMVSRTDRTPRLWPAFTIPRP